MKNSNEQFGRFIGYLLIGCLAAIVVAATIKAIMKLF